MQDQRKQYHHCSNCSYPGNPVFEKKNTEWGKEEFDEVYGERGNW
jgi:hypothetical protein